MKKSFILIMLMLPFGTMCNQEKKNLLIVDTFCNESYSYNNLSSFCNKLDYQVDCIKFFELRNKYIEKYDVVVLVVSNLFLIKQNHFIVSDVINALKEFLANSKNRIVGLILPNNLPKKKKLFLKAKKIIQKLGVLDEDTKFACKQEINSFLACDFYKFQNYDTALFCKKDDSKTPATIDSTNQKAVFLPASFSESSLKSFPLGLYIKNKYNNNQLFLSKIPLMFFNEVSEDFKINPINKELRNQLVQRREQVLYALKSLSENKSELEYKPNTDKVDAKKEVKNNLPWAKNGIRCGWFDFNAFNELQIQKTIKNIVEAKLNLIWIRFNPELYLSKNAIYANEREQYLKNVGYFTTCIKEAFTKLNEPFPKIFIGMEITGNYKPKEPLNSMVDIYGLNYTKIPSPFDIQNFWNVELIDVITDFANAWNSSVGNGLNIDGIFLDFEMYHAQDQESCFVGTSDFSNCALKRYKEVTNDTFDFNNAIKYLYKENKLEQYFAVLKHEAKQLGKYIRQHIKTLLPNTMIAAYMPGLADNWFYTSILSGLSNENDPIIYATFNMDFLSHQHWFEQNQIYCLHMPVILLSKFRTLDDFGLIRELKELHSGVWYNRFSRLACEHQKDKWWTVESTEMDHDLVVKEIGKN